MKIESAIHSMYFYIFANISENNDVSKQSIRIIYADCYSWVISIYNFLFNE